MRLMIEVAIADELAVDIIDNCSGILADHQPGHHHASARSTNRSHLPHRHTLRRRYPGALDRPADLSLGIPAKPRHSLGLERRFPAVTSADPSPVGQTREATR
jgi:hypothetical protein